jgi:acetyl esterase
MTTTTILNRTAIQDVATDPRLHTQVRAFLKVLNESGNPPLETLRAEDARTVLERAQREVKVDLSGIEVTKKMIKSEGQSVKLYILRPEGRQDKLPVFMFIHGGGWVLGDFPTHQRMVRDLVVLSGAAAVFVEYSRAPEAPYPQALNEIYAATRWVARHGDEINVDGNNLAVVGNSAGGNMATVTALKAKLNGGPAIRLQILMWPTVDTSFDNNTYRLFGKDRFLTTPLIRWMYNLYLPDNTLRKDIFVAPLLANIEQLKGMPPTLIQTAENDVLRDEGEDYGRKLDKAGVPVTVVRYNGMIHDFGLLNGLSELPATKSLFIQAAAELKKYLHS